MSKFKDQDQEAYDDLVLAQTILGQLGYTLTSDGKYYKDYGIQNGSTVRMVPIFDHGMSMDVQRRLTGFTIVTSKQIPIVEGIPAPFEEFPIECIDDVNTIINSLAPLSKISPVESFMVTQICSSCNNEVHSFMYMNGQYICLNCAGFSDSESR